MMKPQKYVFVTGQIFMLLNDLWTAPFSQKKYSCVAQQKYSVWCMRSVLCILKTCYYKISIPLYSAHNQRILVHTSLVIWCYKAKHGLGGSILYCCCSDSSRAHFGKVHVLFGTPLTNKKSFRVTVTRIISGPWNLPYSGRLTKLKLFSLANEKTCIITT